MDTKQIKEMYKNNMGFGSHGDNHLWWQYLDYKNQVKEIKNSIDFFKKIKYMMITFQCVSHMGAIIQIQSKFLKILMSNLLLLLSLGV